MANSDKHAVQEAALAYLKRSELSEHQLRSRLQNKNFDPQAVSQAVEKLLKNNYLDDRRLAENLVRHAYEHGRGPRWVHQALVRRGVSDELVTEAEASSRETQYERARHLLANRYGPLAQQDPATAARASRFLIGRGFELTCATDIVVEVFGIGDDASMGCASTD